jgi:molybdopterin-guanine dinucleotide biosynthesis protein A
MADTSAPAVTAFVLAGGKSTRMGRDKALMDHEGRTLLARAVEVVRAITPQVRVVGSHEKFGDFAPVVEDIFRDCGPLAGIHAALLSSQTELNLMLAVDMPFVSASFLEYLLQKARDTGDATVVVPSSGGKMQPLCAMYRPQFAAVAETALRAGKNRIDTLFAAVSCRVLEEQELKAVGFSPAIFHNFNTPEDVEAGKRKDRGRLNYT